MAQHTHDSTAGGTEPRLSRPTRAALVTVVLGLLLTAVLSWAADRADDSTERSLLETQSRQAASVLSTAIFVIQQPLTTALGVQSAAGPGGDPSVFRRTFAVNVTGEDALFVSASLWRADGDHMTRLAAVGAPPGIDPEGSRVQELLHRALASKTSVVQRVEMGDETRFAYALGDPTTGLVVKVERALPKDRRAPVDRDSAFKDLDYAIYLGEKKTLPALTTTDVDPAELPLEGHTYTTSVPFGDSYLTMETRATRHLGSGLSQWLQLILLVGGLLATAATAYVARQLVGARIRAEDDSSTITDLYQRINSLYEGQRALFLRLQRALLPHVDPEIPELEIASKYVAGAEGVEIGGDWYSIIAVGEDHFGFVVGDVSGRGVDTVAEMARARFTLRAYLLDGDGPAEALEKCSRQFDIAVDGHIVTAVVGRGTWSTGEVVLASAGHPLPLLVSGDGAEEVQIPVGPPLGVGVSSYATATCTMPTGSTLIAFTDGLVERRDEDIDTGMGRLARVAEQHHDEPVDELLTSLLDDMRGDGAPDDIAILAVRRQHPA